MWKCFTTRFTADLTKEKYESSFSIGKRVSDFAGMVLRLGFLLVATVFFYELASGEADIYGNIYFVCMLLSAGLTLRLYAAILNISILWFVRITVGNRDVPAMVLLILGLVMTAVTAVGVSELTVELAKAAKVLTEG